jgi:hypothetical protein
MGVLSILQAFLKKQRRGGLLSPDGSGSGEAATGIRKPGCEVDLAYQENGTTQISLTQCLLNYPSAGDTSTTIPAATKKPSQAANELGTEGYTASAAVVAAPANAPSTTGDGD